MYYRQPHHRNRQTVTIRIDRDQLRHLRQVALTETIEQGLAITYGDLIRRAVAAAYPPPEVPPDPTDPTD